MSKGGGKSGTLYFDGSHNNQANKAGAGCIIMDNKGVFVVAAAYNITETFPDDCNVAIAEAVALRNGLKLAKAYNVSPSLIKGDSKEVIDHVRNCSRRPSKPPLSSIIQEIVGMITSNIKLINREDNKAADKLASWGSTSLQRGSRIFLTFSDLPPEVAKFVKDKGKGSSMFGNIAMAGAALAGVAMVGVGFSKLLSESSTSSDQNEHNKSKAIANQPSDFFTTINKFASKIQNSFYYILHFNGSDINQYDKGGAGCIIRNKEGELIVAGAYNLDDLNKYPKQFHVAIAGAVALLNGLKLAKQNTSNGKLHLIEGKNEEVINRVLRRQKRSPEHQYLTELIAQIQQEIDPETLKLMGVDEENEVAHELANYGSKKLKVANQEIYFRENDLPPKVARLLEQDKNIWRAQKFLM